MNKDFLLSTETAKELYYDTARDLPLIDYHNHLDMKALSSNRQFDNVADIWLKCDPYKHRAMRICGVEEKYISGNASDKEKFDAWCATYPKLIGGPLYDWSRLEAEQIFGLDIPICAENADLLWNSVNEKLTHPEFYARNLLESFKPEYCAPCTSIVDDLTPFEGLKCIAPSLRGDDMIVPSPEFLKKLSHLTSVEIRDLDSYMEAVGKRLEEFHKVGCRFSDHALDNGFSYIPDDGKCGERFSRVLAGETLTGSDRTAMISAVLRGLASQYARKSWSMQLHIGAQRSTSSFLRASAGAVGGFAGIGHTADVSSIARMLDDMEKSETGMPRIILFTLNPADNAVMAVLSGSYTGNGRPALVTQGPAWWWCDHLQGMREMLDVFACYSVLSTFIGMTTDSRSILSFLRHDYFRRTLCGWIGEKVKRGEFPNDGKALSELVYNMCYGNVKNIISEE